MARGQARPRFDRHLPVELRDDLERGLAEVRSEANDAVAKFEECFPRLRKEWRPRLESRARVDLCDDRIVLRAKADLALGQARGDEARVLIVDFKTSGSYPTHVDDLRF